MHDVLAAADTTCPRSVWEALQTVDRLDHLAGTFRSDGLLREANDITRTADALRRWAHLQML